MKPRLLFAAALLLAAAFANAQQHMPPGKWWQRAEVIKELQLTNEQRDKLDEIFRAAADGLIDAKANVEKLQVALRGELDRAQLRRAEVIRIAGQLNDARGRLFEREITMLLDMRGVLSDEQWNDIRDRLDQRPMGPGHGGPGGPRGPGRDGMPGRGRRP
jgi:Spy/CpxP family protein refolding chaperone